jgi:hypothetical protein
MSRVLDRLAPQARACLLRTRSAVWNVLVVDGIAIALSGLVLRRRPWDLAIVPRDVAAWWMNMILLGLIVASTAMRLVSVLPWAARRENRFLLAHVLSAGFGALALPLGFLYGWAVRPRLEGVAPCWAVAIVLGLLSLPRTDEAELIEVEKKSPGPGDDD